MTWGVRAPIHPGNLATFWRLNMFWNQLECCPPRVEGQGRASKDAPITSYFPYPYPYPCISCARLRFKLPSSMVPTVKLHFSNNDQYRRDNYQCWDCSFVDSSEHIMKTCGAYEEFRKGKNLDNDLDLVNFFHQVIEKRLNSEDSNDPGDLC